MKRILLLGGSSQQIPAIEYAKKRGYFTILCDFLRDNPGQHYADKFFCVSTTNKEAILKLAKKENIDGIVAYASDPAAPTAAYVAEKIGLPTNPFNSVEILAYKDKFREFLKANNFNSPKAESFVNLEVARQAIKHFKFPIIVKPIDSSGSKGVGKVECIEDFEHAFISALDQSRNRSVIVEEFIVRDHNYLIGGDCFVINGRVEFWGLLNCHRDLNVNPLVPVGKSYPLLLDDKRIDHLKKEVQRVVELLGIKFGGFNLEAIFDNKDNLYLIEMGPRNGGNMIPDLLKMITGVDLVAATVEASMGNKEINLQHTLDNRIYSATYNLHTSENGIFKGVVFDAEIENKVVKRIIYKKIGETVQYFDGANKAIGIVFLKFDSFEQMLQMMNQVERLIKVIVE